MPVEISDYEVLSGLEIEEGETFHVIVTVENNYTQALHLQLRTEVNGEVVYEGSEFELGPHSSTQRETGWHTEEGDAGEYPIYPFSAYPENLQFTVEILGYDEKRGLSDDAYKEDVLVVTEKTEEEYDMTINIDGEGEELNYGEGTHSVKEGETVELEASSFTGWEFDEWSGYVSSSDKTISFEMPDEDISLTAHFKKEEYDLTINIEGEGSELNYGEGTHSFEYEESITLEADSDTGWEFVEWTGEKSSSNKEITFDMPSSDTSITAHFEKEEYTLSINIEGEGSELNYGEGDHNFEYEETVELEASSAEGWDFVEWTGYKSSIQKIVSFDMPSSDTSITAHFEEFEDKRLEDNYDGSDGWNEGEYSIYLHEGGSEEDSKHLVELEAGTYEIELHGADGSDASYNGGTGGKVKGTLEIDNDNHKFFISLGEHTDLAAGGWGHFNNGGDGGSGAHASAGGGGGETRLRIEEPDSSTNSLLIAGAGGGGSGVGYDENFNKYVAGGGGGAGGGDGGSGYYPGEDAEGYHAGGDGGSDDSGEDGDYYTYSAVDDFGWEKDEEESGKGLSEDDPYDNRHGWAKLTYLGVEDTFNITIDGEDIVEITIDGDPVTGLTIDNEVVF